MQGDPVNFERAPDGSCSRAERGSSIELDQLTLGQQRALTLFVRLLARIAARDSISSGRQGR